MTESGDAQRGIFAVEAPVLSGLPPFDPQLGGDVQDGRRSTAEKLLRDERVQCYLLRPKTLAARAVCLSAWLILVCGIGVFCWFIVPLVLTGVVNPLQEAIRDKWNPIAVAFLVVAGVCFVPVIFLPAGPFIWLAAASLGVWKGFLVVQLGTVLGMTLSYFLGKRLLRKRIRRWVENKDWAQALFIAVKEAGPFKVGSEVVLLMRLGPAPYAWLSYACSLSPDIHYWPYITASFLGRAPHNLLDLYIGSGVSTAGKAAEGKDLDGPLVAAYAVGFVLTVGVTLWAAYYAKRALWDLRKRAVARDQVLTAFSFPELEENEDEESGILENWDDSAQSTPVKLVGVGNPVFDRSVAEAEQRGLLQDRDPSLTGSKPVAERLDNRVALEHGKDDLECRSTSGAVERQVMADCTVPMNQEEDGLPLLTGQSYSSMHSSAVS